MSVTATREILWNVNTLTNVVVMYGLFALSLLIGAVGVVRRGELWFRTGKASDENTGSYISRFLDLLSWGLLQEGVVRERVPALFHSLIYIGFPVLLFTTTMVFIDHDLGIRIYHGDFYLAVTLLSDLFGFGLLVGCLIAAHRRYILRSDLVHKALSEGVVLFFLIVLVVQGFALEALRIHATADPWARYSPVGYLLSKFFWPLSVESAGVLHYGMWWFHTVTVFAFVALFPYTKFFHILASTANLFFRGRARPLGALPSPGDLEKLMESGEEFTIGFGSIRDYTWKELLDLDACTSCGRCQDACPAYNSGKILSPKWLILDSRNHMLALHAEGRLNGGSSLPERLSDLDRTLTASYLASSNVRPNNAGAGRIANGAYRARNPLVQESSIVIGGNADARIAGDVIDQDVFWSCVTCMACVEACPVGIDHVDHIVQNRRNMVLMNGEIPAEAQGTLRKLENQGNPFGDPQAREDWLKELGVTPMKPGDSVDYLYWVGCVSAFDPRKQKIAKAMVKILRAAGLSFGVLGKLESCSGDPARRLGEENLYQMLAKRNIAALQTVKFKTLVANCPHCFNTIKNEYPQFGRIQQGDGDQPSIIHHSALVQHLLRTEALPVQQNATDSYTFHDPCYLGRYNGEFDAPRDAVAAVTGTPVNEMKKSREKGMCCGAGGGHFWMDLKVGERINSLRVEQAAETGSSRIATGCPFCMQMMEDGVKLTGREGKMEVRDIAEVVADSLS